MRKRVGKFAQALATAPGFPECLRYVASNLGNPSQGQEFVNFYLGKKEQKDPEAPWRIL